MDDMIIYAKDVIATLELAEALGNKKITILFTKHDIHHKEVLQDLQKHSSLQLQSALLVKNVKEAQKYVAHYDYLMGEASRDLIESKLVTHIYDAEVIEGKDKTHRRGSGLNQVTAKLLADKQKTYCFNLHTLLTSQQILILGRMQQNKRILQKYDCHTVCYSFAEKPLQLRAKNERKLFLENL